MGVSRVSGEGTTEGERERAVLRYMMTCIEFWFREKLIVCVFGDNVEDLCIGRLALEGAIHERRQ